jgi:hypothetical protein
MDKTSLRELPCREPRGSPQNILRMYMMREFLRGLSREEAERAARDKMQAKGLPGWDCPVRYGDGSHSEVIRPC